MSGPFDYAKRDPPTPLTSYAVAHWFTGYWTDPGVTTPAS